MELVVAKKWYKIWNTRLFSYKEGTQYDKEVSNLNRMKVIELMEELWEKHNEQKKD